MKVTGFSFIKNAIKYDYPIVEAIRSILPICDDFVVAVGESSDATLELIQSIDPEKIRIVQTVWDKSLREGGRVLAEETDKAFAAIAEETDWCFYIQGDEVVHEQYLERIRAAMLKHKDNNCVDGLLFKYKHFYGSYDYVGASSKWYRKEIRLIKNDKNIYSYQDAQGFRKGQGEKLRVVPIDAYIYHYGWVKEPEAMQRKHENFSRYWHDDDWMQKHTVKAERFDYFRELRALERFEGEHPKVMQQRIREKNWQFDHDISMNKFSLKDSFKALVYKYLGVDLNYQNYKIIKP